MSNKARRRGIELQQIIEFDVAAYDLFDMPPVKEYDMYIRSFGGTNTKQVKAMKTLNIKIICIVDYFAPFVQFLAKNYSTYRITKVK